MYIKIGHCPIVRLSIVMRAVSQCSVIINHAFIFVTPNNSFTPHSANTENFIVLKLQLSLLLKLNVSWRSAFEFAKEFWSPRLEQLNAPSLANADREEKFPSICILLSKNTFLRQPFLFGTGFMWKSFCPVSRFSNKTTNFFLCYAALPCLATEES